jgi:hypothetical protein
MAFSTTAAKTYPMRSPGVVRTWMFGGGNGRTTGLAVTNPTAIFVEVYGTSFDSGTATVQYASDNATWANLTTVSLAFTANGTGIIANADTKTGFYSINLTGTAGTASNLVANIIALGATDVE